jgi:hypothetical protein
MTDVEDGPSAADAACLGIVRMIAAAAVQLPSINPLSYNAVTPRVAATAMRGDFQAGSRTERRYHLHHRVTASQMSITV